MVRANEYGIFIFNFDNSELSEAVWKIYRSHPCRFDSSTVADDSAELRGWGGHYLLITRDRAEAY